MTAITTFRDLIERNAHLYGDELALQFEERRWTFRDYARRVMKLGDALYNLGLRHQERVAILAMNCAEYLEVFGAADVSGFITAPVNFRLAPPEIAYIVNDAAPRVLVFESQYAATVDALRPSLKSVQHYVCIGADVPPWALAYQTLLESGAESGPPLRPAPTDLLSILYTSGTTGRPKGVMSNHEGFIQAAMMQAFEFWNDLGDRFLLTMPLYHLGGRLFYLVFHWRAATVILHRTFDPLAMLRTIEAERITHIHVAPTMLQAIMDAPGFDDFDVSSLKLIEHAAAPISLTLLKRALAKFGPILIDGYGQTEGGGTVLRRHHHKPDGTDKERKRLESVGQPLTHTRLRIVDENDCEVPVGSIGEVCMQTGQTMVGYWNNMPATIEALRGGWLHTGDMGYVDEDSFLYLVDRKKDMIISGGENIYSREVEEAVMAHPQVSDAAVIGVPDDYWGESVTAVVVLKPGAQLEEAALIEHCRTLIARYKCPKNVIMADQLPRVPSGKVNKVALREQHAGKKG